MIYYTGIAYDHFPACEDTNANHVNDNQYRRRFMQSSMTIDLTQGFVATVSSEDYDWLIKYNWHVHFSGGKGRKAGKPYARTNINGKKVYMHRLIVFPDDPSKHVDHWNFQTLDNRRCNLKAMDAKDNIKKRMFSGISRKDLLTAKLL